MRKFFKYLLITLVSLVILACIAIGILIYTVNPNDFKETIIKNVKEKTGRDLAIEGDITWRVFPWLGFDIHDIAVSNTANFNPQTKFLNLKEAEVSLKVMPLFTGIIEFGKIRIDGLHLELVTNANGQNNWDDLVKPQSTPSSSVSNSSSTAQTSKFKLTGFKVSSVEISRAAVNYFNEKANQKYVLHDFNFQSRHISLNSMFPVSMNFGFTRSNPMVEGQASLSTEIALNQAEQSIAVSPFVINATLRGDKFPKEGLSIHLNSQFIMRPKAISVTQLTLDLDQSEVTGNAYLALSPSEQSQFDLKLDKIDIANYLPSQSQISTAQQNVTSSNRGGSTSPVLFVSQLRQLNLKGKLRIGTFNYNKFTMNNVNVNVSANNGLIQFAPNSANLYQGQWRSNIALNVQSNTPVWQINEVVNNVQIEPFMAAFYQNKNLQMTGVGTIKTTLSTSGTTPSAMTQNLNGTAQFAITNGIIKGVNLGYQVARAMAVVNKQNQPSEPYSNQTPFGSLTGTVQIKNGVATNNDLNLQSQALTVKGNGTVNFNDQQLRYSLNTTMIQNQVDPKIYTLQQKIGGSFPLMMAGTLTSFKVYPDVTTIVKNLVTSYVQQHTDKLKQNLDGNLQNIGKQLQNKLQNLLGP